MIGVVSRTRAVLVASSLLPALLLAGCSDDDPEPKFGPTPSATPSSASPSATATASALGPEETVRAWVDAQNAAMEGEDSSAVRALATSDCSTCDSLVDPVDEVITAGGRFETAGWTVDHLKAVNSESNSATVKAAITIAGGRTYPSADATPVKYDVDRSILEFKLRNVDGAWRIAFVGFLS